MAKPRVSFVCARVDFEKMVPARTHLFCPTNDRWKVYNTDNTVLIPGSGTYGMEAVARQYGEGRKVLVIRNGYFSYRWSQLFDAMAGSTGELSDRSAFHPPPHRPWSSIHHRHPSRRDCHEGEARGFGRAVPASSDQ